MHSPSSFMARRYSSSKDSFITAQVAWQICGSMGTGAVGQGTRSEPFQSRKLPLLSPTLPAFTPTKTQALQTTACLAPEGSLPEQRPPFLTLLKMNNKVPASPRAETGDEVVLGAQDLWVVLLS